MIPTVKRMLQTLNVTAEQAKAIRKAMETAEKAPSPGWPTFWGRPYEDAMKEIDRILETCGVEYVEKGGAFSPAFSYCNTGDSYAPTILLIWEDGTFAQTARFIISSWGDWVERRHYD